ncbi:Myogenin [Myotis brandtii]|uniref:Myogenin n=1 Tax=Myotis brandtii TaxID=109478 RepID=S7NTW2_MYOBR|nr:Myogenin [Myotis brandtii]
MELYETPPYFYQEPHFYDGENYLPVHLQGFEPPGYERTELVRVRGPAAGGHAEGETPAQEGERGLRGPEAEHPAEPQPAAAQGGDPAERHPVHRAPAGPAQLPPPGGARAALPTGRPPGGGKWLPHLPVGSGTVLGQSWAPSHPCVPCPFQIGQAAGQAEMGVPSECSSHSASCSPEWGSALEFGPNPGDHLLPADPADAHNLHSLTSIVDSITMEDVSVAFPDETLPN